jgi:hypothetical protein
VTASATQVLAGYTAITLTWSPAEDRTPAAQPLGLDNPQALLVAPRERLAPGGPTPSCRRATTAA